MNDYSIYLFDALEQNSRFSLLNDEALINIATQEAMLIAGCYDLYEDSGNDESH